MVSVDIKRSNMNTKHKSPLVKSTISLLVSVILLTVAILPRVSLAGHQQLASKHSENSDKQTEEWPKEVMWGSITLMAAGGISAVGGAYLWYKSTGVADEVESEKLIKRGLAMVIGGAVAFISGLVISGFDCKKCNKTDHDDCPCIGTKSQQR